MKAESFLAVYTAKKADLVELLKLRDYIMNKWERMKRMYQSFKTLHLVYCAFLTKAVMDPEWMPKEEVSYHIRNYFLLFVFVADEYFFMRNGRKLQLNKDNQEYPCDPSTKNGYFNKDYTSSERNVVSLSYCSFDGYEVKAASFKKYLEADIRTVPKVIDQFNGRFQILIVYV
jgi:hypothetical protein